MTTMELSAEQHEAISGWIESGLSLSDVQKNIQQNWDIPMTYMDVRFLVDDLNLALKDKEKPKAVSADEPTSPVQEASSADSSDQVPGAVQVSVDTVKRPGAMASGSVVFSDGISCQWQVDTMGRLGLVPAQEGYQPSEQDIQDFQIALQGKLQGL